MGIVLWGMHSGVMDVHILAFQPFNQERRFVYWQMMCSCRFVGEKEKRDKKINYRLHILASFFLGGDGRERGIMWNKIFVVYESCRIKKNKKKKKLMISRKRVWGGGGGGGREGEGRALHLYIQYNTNIYNNRYICS